MSKPEREFKLDFVGIGAPKCGTTWVAKQLAAHPELDVCSIKEPNYFLDEAVMKKLVVDFSSQYHISSAQKFRSLFKHDGRKRGEFSVYYLYSPRALKKIYQQNPDVKIIICLRNPAAASQSFYTYFKNSITGRNWPDTFLESFRSAPYYKNLYAYAKHIENVLDIFPRKNVHIILNEDIKADSSAVLGKLYAFLDVNAEFRASDYDKPVYETTQLRSPMMAQLAAIPTKLLRTIGAHGLLDKLYPYWQRLNKAKSGPKDTTPGRETAVNAFEKDVAKLDRLLPKQHIKTKWSAH